MVTSNNLFYPSLGEYTMNKLLWNLYNEIKKNLMEYINPSEFSWRDPESNVILWSISCGEVEKRQKFSFLVIIFIYSILSQNICFLASLFYYILPMIGATRDMKCDLPGSIGSMCGNFVRNFRELGITSIFRNIVHDKIQKESNRIGKKNGMYIEKAVSYLC